MGLVLPTASASLSVSQAYLSWATTFSNAGLALGAVFAADLVQRFGNRPLFLTFEGLFILGSVIGAVAPDAELLIAGHIIQGLATGLLLVASLPPLITSFPVKRLKSTIIFVVIGLFGAVTAGPLVGGYVAQTGAWRLLFAATVVLGVAAFVLALLTLPHRPPLNPGLPVDVPALALSTAGAGLTFYGVGALMSHPWYSPRVYATVVLGVVALVTLVVVEVRKDQPLMPARPLLSTFPVMGILAAIISGAVFTGLLQLLILFLTGVRGLSTLEAVSLLWPNIATGLGGAVIVGVVLPSRWVLTMPLFGMLCLGLAAWPLTNITPETGKAQVLLISGALGVGASLTVTPGLLMAALSTRPVLVGRAIALVELLRLCSAYLLAPVLVSFAMTYGTGRQGLAAGLHLLFTIVFGITVAGIFFITLVFVLTGARLHPPQLESYLEEGYPALRSPPVRRSKPIRRNPLRGEREDEG